MIRASRLTKKYGDIAVVDHISFDIEQGEIFGFLGPNGAGKTTIIRMLTTLASITDGEATVAGHDLKKDPASVRSKIGVVPQETALDNELKGIENLLISAKLHHVSDSVAMSRARELLKLVELETAADRRVSTYSSGMKKRLQLVTALIHKPEVLFLDEPTVGLDIQTRTKIWNYIQQLSKDDGLTVFMTTHYLEEADHLSDRVAIMDHGQIKVSGSPAKLKESLRGDILTVQLSDGHDDLTDFLSKIENVAEVSKAGSSYRLTIPKVETALPNIITSITSKGLLIEQTSFTKPTLDQVFLEVTGRSMRDAEESQSEILKNHGKSAKGMN